MIDMPLGVYIGRSLIMGIQIAKNMPLNPDSSFLELGLTEEQYNKIGLSHAFAIREGNIKGELE